MNGDRREQQHGGDVVEESRQHGGDRAQNHHEGPNRSPAFFVRQDGEVLEHTGVGENPHHDHHAQQQPDGFPIDHRGDFSQGERIARVVIVQGKHGDNAADGSRQGPVDRLKNNQDVDGDENGEADVNGLGFQSVFDVDLEANTAATACLGGVGNHHCPDEHEQSEGNLSTAIGKEMSVDGQAS